MKFSLIRKKSDLQERIHEDWCEKAVEDGFGSRESVERRSRGHRAYRKVAIEEADGSSSWQGEVDTAFLVLGATMATLAWAEGFWFGKRSKQRIDESSMQQERNPSTVSQLLTRIQNLRNKVNSLTDAREFDDPETASGSGASHVPSQPFNIPSP